jgi:hypothetical protein
MATLADEASPKLTVAHEGMSLQAQSKSNLNPAPFHQASHVKRKR